VTDGIGGYSGPLIDTVANDLAVIVTTSGGVIYHANLISGFPAIVHLSDPQSQGSLSLAPAAGFLEYLAYEQVDGSGSPDEQEIRIATNPAGPFSVFEILTDNDFIDRDPVVYYSSNGQLHVAWVSEEIPGDPVVRYRFASNPQTIFALGEQPHLLDGGGGTVFAVYQRGGDLYGRIISQSGVVAPESLLLDLPFPFVEWTMFGADGDLHLVVLNAGQIEYRAGSISSGFGVAVAIPSGTVADSPQIELDAMGQVVLCWAESGEVYWTRNDGSTWSAPAGINAEGGATEAAIAGDSDGYLHITYLAGGEVWYTNDVPPPVASFEIFGGIGELPLTPQIVNLSSGVISEQLWDFGDGTFSSTSSPEKTYSEPGSFSISLTVEGPGGENTFTINNAISGSVPPNVIEIADIAAFGGQPVIHPLLATHPDALQGFQASIQYNEDVTPIEEINFTGTQVESLTPEFVATNFYLGGEESALIIAVIFDFLPPFDGRSLDPGLKQTLGNIQYTVPFNLPLGTVGLIEFIDGLGEPPINTRFVPLDASSVSPYMLSGSCTVDAQPQFLFVRGDANYNQSVDIADAIFVLSFLFSGGAAPSCPDSADSNDDGAINIGDSVYVLSFLFSSGPTLPYPFPGLGIDPSEDSLAICNP